VASAPGKSPAPPAWQLSPRVSIEAINDSDHAAAKRAVDAMMTLRRIDTATIEAARKRRAGRQTRWDDRLAHPLHAANDAPPPTLRA